MRKRYGQRLALWILALILTAASFVGCGTVGTGGETKKSLPAETVGTAEATGTERQSEETAKPPESGESDELPETAEADGTERQLDTAEADKSAESSKTADPAADGSSEGTFFDAGELPDEDGSYITKEEVALYIHTYGRLPDNFITKKAAKELGWDNSLGNLAEVAPGKSIGGDRFGNYEGLLPDEEGRRWTECDIGYEEGYRNGERIVFSDDGLIYYTGDHYKSFEQLY